MSIITRENMKHHCRTCLQKLEQNEEVQELKNFHIDISTNTELERLLAKYIDDGFQEDYRHELPQSLCLDCFNKLQSFSNFIKHARDSAERLLTILGKAKIEVSDYEDGAQDCPPPNNEDIYKLLLKDTLMETESVLLDGTAVSTLASVEMQIPDPFDNTPPSKELDMLLGGHMLEKSDDDNENDIDCACSNSSGGEASELEFVVSTERRGEEKQSANSKMRSRLRTRARTALSPNAQTAKKKRRSKTEMEAWRKEQSDNMDNKIKRRNKGTKNSFKCLQCNHSFAHKITLDAHIRKVHEGSKRPFQCDRCDKSYTFIGGLYTHIKEIHETEVRSYSCDFAGCERIYTSYVAMQKHKRVKHTDAGHQKKYVCEQCGATFNQTGNLKYHRRTKHPTEAEQAEREKSKERFECTLCKKLFHSRYTLKYHTLQLHSNDMKYECTVCGRRMAKKFMLVQHMLVHSTDKMPCEHCGKQFIRKFELEAHIRAVHMKLKPFECQYCSECFASRKTLRHHEYIHTGEKPYVCDICGQAYRQQTCLKNHRKSHDKMSAEALLAANINRTLMHTFLGATTAAAMTAPATTTTTTTMATMMVPTTHAEIPPALPN